MLHPSRVGCRYLKLRLLTRLGEHCRYASQVFLMTDAEKNAIVASLDHVIRSVAPDASTIIKYGGTLYTLYPNDNERQFCGLFAYSNHVQLSFARGAEIDDPFGILAGNGKSRRHINFSNADAVDSEKIKALVLSAIALDN